MLRPRLLVAVTAATVFPLAVASHTGARAKSVQQFVSPTAPTPAAPEASSSQIDLVVTNVDGPDPVQFRTRLSYTVTVSNRGPNDATNVLLTDRLPGTLSLLGSTTSQGTCSAAPILVCALGTVQPGQVATAVLLVRPTRTGRLENTATALGSETDANPADNTATAVTTVLTLTRPPAVPRAPATCVAFRPVPLALVAGRSAPMRVVATVGRRSGKDMRVVVSGAGIHATARTRSAGVAILRVRPTRPGFLTVTMPGRRTCVGPRRVAVVAPILKPPVTG